MLEILKKFIGERITIKDLDGKHEEIEIVSVSSDGLIECLNYETKEDSSEDVFRMWMHSREIKAVFVFEKTIEATEE